MKNIKVISSCAAVIAVGVVSFMAISWKKDVKYLPPVDYVKYVKDSKNGLTVVKHMDKVDYSAQYRSAEYMVASEQKDPYLKTDMFNKEKLKYADLEYYLLQISTANGNQDVLTINLQSEEEYTKRQGYYSFAFENDIVLVEGIDTLPCAIFNYVPNYGLSPHIDFLLAFTKNKNESDGKLKFDRNFIINDQVMGYGTVKLTLKKEDLNNIPSLTTY
jgi:hypothetical protein